MELIKINRESGIPLFGAIQFGVIDRGTNLIQVRATTVCNLKCLYCSTNANNPEAHPVNFEVELDYLLETVKSVIEFKNEDVECNIDSVGEPTAYPYLVELIKGLKKFSNVSRVSMQTNGTLLTLDKIKSLEAAGLDQINLSLNGSGSEIPQCLSGTATYNVNHVKTIANAIAVSKIDLLLAPVWIPKINDSEITSIIQFSKEINSKIGIQKYEEYSYSRKVKGVKLLNYWKFYRQLGLWEKEFGVKLLCRKQDFGIHKSQRLPVVLEVGDKISVKVLAPGWWKRQSLAAYKNNCITLDKCNLQIGDIVKVKITSNKNNIYLARLV